MNNDESDVETLHCPKCGEDQKGAYALLGHIYTSHWIVNEGEVGGDV